MCLKGDSPTKLKIVVIQNLILGLSYDSCHTKHYWFLLTSIVFFGQFSVSQWEPKQFCYQYYSKYTFVFNRKKSHTGLELGWCLNIFLFCLLNM